MTGEKNKFDQKAVDWDKKKRRVELARAVSSAIKELLPEDQPLEAMEYGCGTGLVGLALAPKLRSLLAVDTSGGMLEVLEKKMLEQGFGNVNTKRFDLTSADLDKKFDLIFCAMTLHHIENSDLILKKFATHLKDGGILAIADLDKEDGSFHEGTESGNHHDGFDRDELRKKLSGAGLYDINFTTIYTIMRKVEGDREKPFPIFFMRAYKK